LAFGLHQLINYPEFVMKVVSVFILFVMLFSPSTWAVSSNCVQVLGQMRERSIKKEEALRLYQVYKNAKDKAEAIKAKNALIEYLYPMARSIASQYARTRGLRNSDDLVQDAAFGIMGAIESFDPNQGEILSYISKRAFGQMIDAQRQSDWVPRRVRKASRKLEQLKQSYLTAYGATDPSAPSFEDFVRQEISDPIEAAQLLKDGSRLHMMRPWSSIQGRQSRFQSDAEPRDTFAEQPSRSEIQPELKTNREDVWVSLSRNLGERDRTMFDLYFRYDQPMREIAQQLGLSEARISQRLKNIIQIIKLKMHDFPEFREDLLEVSTSNP
jgi:RNA polymerase sigma factor for flagellar operon FliA